MPLTDAQFAAAREGKPAALTALLAEGYAPARRVAHALSGRADVGQAVANLLVRQSLRLIPRWRDPSTAENWFLHHAVLTTRGAQVPPPADPMADPLVGHGAEALNPIYVAFVRALRNLPPQQREAFILHHGERLNARLLSLAMDCSTQAAVTHLAAATAALAAVADVHVDELAAVLTRAYAHLRDSQPDATPHVRVQVRRIRRRIWTRRLMRVVLVLLVLAVVAGVVWVFRDALLGLFAESPAQP